MLIGTIFQEKASVWNFPNSLNHESFFSWNLSNQNPFGDSFGDTVSKDNGKGGFWDV